MSVSKYPDTPLLDGAIGVVFEGFMSKGGITYTTRTVGDGTYALEVNSYTGGAYTVHFPNNKVVQKVEEPSLNIIKLTTSESSIALKVVNRWATGALSGTNGIFQIFRNNVFVNGISYHAVSFSTGTSPTERLGGIIATTDGVNWTTVYNAWTSGRPTLGFINNGNNVYFTASQDNVGGNLSRVTTNFTNWNTPTYSTGNTHGSWIAGGNGLFLQLIDGLSIAVSTNNGANFNLTVVSGGNRIGTRNCVYSPVANAFVAAGNPTTTNRNRVAYSTDGVTWAWQTIPSIPATTTGNQGTIAYGDGYFALATDNSLTGSFLVISSNGQTWTIAKSFATNTTTMDSVSFADGWFTRHSNKLNYTADFNNWTSDVHLGNGNFEIYNSVISDQVFSFNNVLMYTALAYGATVSSDQSYVKFHSMGKNTLN